MSPLGSYLRKSNNYLDAGPCRIAGISEANIQKSNSTEPNLIQSLDWVRFSSTIEPNWTPNFACLISEPVGLNWAGPSQIH